MDSRQGTSIHDQTQDNSACLQFGFTLQFLLLHLHNMRSCTFSSKTVAIFAPGVNQL